MAKIRVRVASRHQKDIIMAKKMTGPRVLTANLLQDGAVVFLNADGAWAPGLERARLAQSDDDI